MLGFLFAALALLAPAAAPPPARVPITLVNNHVDVDVALNAAGPFHFIIDSGAGNPLDPAVAARIGAAVRGRVRLVDTGSRLAAPALGPFARRNPAVVAVSISAADIDGYGIGGAALGRLGLLPSVTFSAPGSLSDDVLAAVNGRRYGPAAPALLRNARGNRRPRTIALRLEKYW